MGLVSLCMPFTEASSGQVKVGVGTCDRQPFFSGLYGRLGIRYGRSQASHGPRFALHFAAPGTSEERKLKIAAGDLLGTPRGQ
ncbi:hypothetical protein EV356DRAFT_502168 [Viridothelium virens]|uniref:Uncharacterized protein n=1 Tax=Viridothelium virens TaxID=1048519 RepID=A0A6A6HMF4_VIRVR|nr:hypothetical protein EV356DRAFT_502168 [Viridothelium virens]